MTSQLIQRQFAKEVVITVEKLHTSKVPSTNDQTIGSLRLFRSKDLQIDKLKEALVVYDDDKKVTLTATQDVTLDQLIVLPGEEILELSKISTITIS